MQKIIEKLKALEGSHSKAATPVELVQLRETLNFDIPQELLQLLQIYNGDTTNPTLLGDYVELLSTDYIIEQYLQLCNLTNDELDVLIPLVKCDKRIKSYMWSKKWIPFLSMNGLPYAIDLNPTEFGTVGQIIFIDWEFSTNVYCASSLTVFLEKIYELRLRGGYTDYEVVYYFENLSE